jgi:hypothetical protein
VEMFAANPADHSTQGACCPHTDSVTLVVHSLHERRQLSPAARRPTTSGPPISGKMRTAHQRVSA